MAQANFMQKNGSEFGTRQPASSRLPDCLFLLLLIVFILPSINRAQAQTDDCWFFEPDQSTWLANGPVVVNQTEQAISLLARPNDSCVLDFSPVQPGGRLKVLVEQDDYLYVRHIDDGYRSAWIPREGLSIFEQSVDCTFIEPDRNSWMDDGPVLINTSDSVVPMLARPNDACRTDLKSIQPGGQVVLLLDAGEYMYIRHIDDNYRNAWVRNNAFSDRGPAVEPVIPPVSDLEPEVSGNTIVLPDNGWYQVQAVVDGKIVEVCAGTRSCEVSAGTYTVINHTKGIRFENVIVDSGLPEASVTVMDNTINWPDDGWYQVQTILDGERVEVCAGTRSCQVANGIYVVINHTSGKRFENVVVSGDPGVSNLVVQGNRILWSDNGWYQVQAVLDGQHVEVCAGTRSCTVAAGVYNVINHTSGERYENITIEGGSGAAAVTVTGNTISWPDNGWYQVQTIVDGQPVEVCAGTRFCEVPNGLYTVINHTTGQRYEQVTVDAGFIADETQDRMIIPTSEVRPFVAGGPYASVLSACAFTASPIVDEDICPLATLPYIGQTTDTITVRHVLERTLVSHDWMGKRLGELLDAMPADMLPLFAPVTAVVVGSEVRPSSFNTSTGRIMIDPAYLWLTVPEKRTISLETDFRGNFGADLKFVSASRWMRGDNYAFPAFSLSDQGTREFEDIIPLAASVLYHELAHANDFVRPQNLARFSAEMSPLQASGMFSEQRLSEQLYSDEALTVLRSPLYGLARVRFADEAASDFQQSVFADYAGSVMGNEGKQVFYSYFNINEDVATLFEHTMMSYHFGVETSVGFMDKPQTHPNAACNDYKVAWGVKNRLAAPLVAPRSRFITERLIGRSESLDAFYNESIGEQSMLRQGAGWCDAHLQAPENVMARSRTSIEDERQFRFERRLFSEYRH